MKQETTGKHTRKIRNRNDHLEVEYQRGKWGQFAAPFRTQWTHPDQHMNAIFSKAADGLIEEMVSAYQHHEELVAMLEKQVGNLLSLAGDPKNYCLAWIVEPLETCNCRVCEIRSLLSKIKGTK